MDIQINKIKPNPDNARKQFKGISELSKDIDKNGLLQKILVRPTGDFFEIVCGERRFRALQLLRRDNIDCEVREITKEDSQKMALSENIQREDLTPIELAIEFKKQLESKTQQDLAKEIGKSQPYINKVLTFLELPELARIYLNINLITPEHARELLRYKKLLGKVGLDEEKIDQDLTIATDGIIDQDVNAKTLHGWIDGQVWDRVKEMKEGEDLTKDQAEMIRWIMKKNTEWCRHEWVNQEGESYCEKCGCVNPLTKIRENLKQ